MKRFLTAVLMPLAAACGPAPQPKPQPTPPTPAPAPAVAQVELPASSIEASTSARFGVRVPLPDGRNWRVDDATGRWLHATHAATSGELLVRTWTSDRINTYEKCEAQARLWRPTLPVRSEESIIEEQLVSLPHGYRTIITIGVHPLADGSIEGYASMFGAAVKRCFAAIYTTSAVGRGAEQAIGDRLGVMVQTSLTKINVLGVEDRSTRQPQKQ